MKIALVYTKAAVAVLAFIAYLIFAFHINDKLQSALSGPERAILISASIAGAGFLIAKANEYLSHRMFRKGS
jgi:hypothetical protein